MERKVRTAAVPRERLRRMKLTLLFMSGLILLGALSLSASARSRKNAREGEVSFVVRGMKKTVSGVT